MRIGLRIDVDTYRGTRLGIPGLCRLLERGGIRATFFCCVGPDNMGRHLWRLLRPAFVRKMLRTKAASLYGWDILLKGTLWPGPVIGKRLGQVIRSAADAGHEVGLHAWDHHAWQASIEKKNVAAVRRCLERGVQSLTAILGKPPGCCAAPAWKCTDAVLLARNAFPFRYNSDCRGTSLFRPTVGNTILAQPQVPTTLPTYDEVLSSGAADARRYNEYLLSLVRPDDLNVLTIHAEVEGLACLPLFSEFLEKARSRGIDFVPLGALVSADATLPAGRIVCGAVPGRDGWVAWQAPAPAALGQGTL